MRMPVKGNGGCGRGNRLRHHQGTCTKQADVGISQALRQVSDEASRMDPQALCPVASAALPGGGSGLFLVDGSAVTRHGYRTFDGQRGAEIAFDDAPAQPLGSGGDAAGAVTEAVIRLQSALCAEAVGAMDESLRLTTDYLKTRKQFGVPLKTFQTLTQRAADMYVSLELARSMSYYLAMSVADGRFDPMVAARAKLQIGRSGKHIAEESIQLHGGIGVTAEYPIAHYAARLTAIDQTAGSADDQLRHLVSQVGSYGTAVL